MIARVWKYLTTNIGIYFAVFVIVWLVAWALNALQKTAFDLNKLEELAKYILGKYGTDSLVNTKFGTKEEKPCESLSTQATPGLPNLEP